MRVCGAMADKNSDKKLYKIFTPHRTANESTTTTARTIDRHMKKYVHFSFSNNFLCAQTVLSFLSFRYVSLIIIICAHSPHTPRYTSSADI